MNKILVIQTASIGDVILATAVVEQLHREYPHAYIDFLVKKGIEPIFDAHPFIRQVLIWDKSIKWKSWRRLLQTIRRQRYDIVINIQRFFLTGLWTILSNAKETRGFDKNPCSFFFSKKVPHTIQKGVHETDRNYALIADLVHFPKERPRLYPLNFPPIVHDNTLYYTISPASLWNTKQYPFEKWIELIRLLPKNAFIFLLGGKKDQLLCQKIKEAASDYQIEIKAGKLSLLESAALMSGAKMNYVNDSSPLHLASSMNAPVTAIYCSTTPDFGFGPLSDQSYIIQNAQCECKPCGLHGKKNCPKKHFDCGYKIDTQQFLPTL